MSHPGAFLDRDGTLIEDVHHLHDPARIRVLDGVPESLLALRAAGYKLVLVSNQSGVARGIFTEAHVDAVNEALQRLLGLRFDAIHTCPHHVDGVVEVYARACDCRKPAPGMLIRAIEALDLDPSRSFIVGDRRSDAEAGLTLGVRGYRVRSGPTANDPDHVGSLPDLAAVVRWHLGG